MAHWQRVGGIALAACVAAFGYGQDRITEYRNLGLPDWAREPACVVSGTNVPVVEGRMRVSCWPSAELQCAAQNAEPIDLLGPDACRIIALPFVPAVSARIRQASRPPASAHVEWLEFNELDSTVKTLATRMLPSMSEWSLPVANVARRVLRFSRPKASPVTVTAAEVLGEPWVLPPPQPGGEAVIRQEPLGTVRPNAYVIVGPLGRKYVIDASNNRHVLGLSGLAEGTYSMRSSYSGGLLGAPTTISITQGETTFLWSQPEALGAVTVSASRCVQGGLVVFAHRDPINRERVVQLEPNGTCEWSVGGLGPGTYQVGMQLAENYIAASEKFTVSPQQVAHVVLELVTLSGRISANGHPLSNADVEVQSSNRQADVVRRTDADGRYQVVLGNPGDYKLVLRDHGVIRGSKEVAVAPGSNEIDWSLDGGSITVRVRGADERQPVSVSMLSRLGTRQESLKPGSLALNTHGLSYDTYLISASQGEGYTSTIETVVLDAEHSSAVVDLTVEHHDSSLSVVGAIDGMPVSSAVVRVLRPADPFGFGPVSPSLPETAPGVFSLKNVPPGVSVAISGAGFVPVCRKVVANTSIVVRTERGRRMVLEFPEDITPASIKIASLSPVSDSDCPVPILEFHPAPTKRADRLGFVVNQFPSSNTFLLMLPRFTRRVYVDDSGQVSVIGRE